MDIADCYRLLELSSGASIAEIKLSYRRLVRQYHPDINSNDQTAKDKFIALTEAYKLLVNLVQPSEIEDGQSNQSQQVVNQDEFGVQRQPATTIKVKRKEEATAKAPPLSPVEQRLKQNSYEQWQQLLKYHRFPKAIALIEALAQRLPLDSQVREWQAITYQRWGRELINKKQLDQARVYLKKALKTDPHNRSLWSEVERDFRRLEKIF